MILALVDTCVWLDLAQDSKQTPLLLVVENMVKSGDLKLNRTAIRGGSFV